MLGKGKFFSSQIKNEYLVNRNTLFLLIILAAHTFFLKTPDTVSSVTEGKSNKNIEYEPNP